MSKYTFPALVGLLTAVYFGIGVWRLTYRRATSPVGWTVRQDLPASYQLRAGDLKEPERRADLAIVDPRESLLGRHLRRPKRAGEQVTVLDVSEKPSFPVCELGSGVLLYTTNKETQVAHSVEIGSWVSLCATTERSGRVTTQCSEVSLQVEAVHRVSGETVSYIALRVPRCERQTVGKFLSSRTHFFLLAMHPSRSLCELH